MSVFAMAELYLELGPGRDRGALMDAPLAGNRNLAAQHGRFVLHAWDVADLLDGTEEQPTLDPAQNVSAMLIDSRLVRLDLEWYARIRFCHSCARRVSLLIAFSV